MKAACYFYAVGQIRVETVDFSPRNGPMQVPTFGASQLNLSRIVVPSDSAQFRT